VAALFQDGGKGVIIQRVTEFLLSVMDLRAEIIAELGYDVVLLPLWQPELNCV